MPGRISLEKQHESFKIPITDVVTWEHSAKRPVSVCICFGQPFYPNCLVAGYPIVHETHAYVADKWCRTMSYHETYHII